MSPIVNVLDKAYCHAIAHCNGQWLSSAYTLIQTAFVHNESTNPHIAQHAHKIQTVFNMADIGWVIWGIKATVDELKKKYDVTTLTSHWSARHYIGGSVGIFTVISLTAFVASSLLNKYFQPRKDPSVLLEADQKTQNISITFERPASQLWAQRLFIVRIVSNIALACLSSSRALPICSLLGQTYSLIKLSQLKWLNFSRVFEFTPHTFIQPRIKKVKISYRALLTPFSNSIKEDICAICQEEKPTSYFCSYHAFHDACLIKLIDKKSECFNQNSSYIRLDIQSRNGASSSYQVSLIETNLPNCPFNCNERYPN
ncbi:MAG: hypothetical protein ACRDFB_00115, partial [Rhabdochlamydiaceae bacterium]